MFSSLPLRRSRTCLPQVKVIRQLGSWVTKLEAERASLKAWKTSVEAGPGRSELDAVVEKMARGDGVLQVPIAPDHILHKPSIQ